MKRKSTSQKKQHFIDLKINPGSTSIMLIFVTLCLVAFAVLCVVSSNSDRKLGNRVNARTTEYYNACNKAQAVISQIDDELLLAYMNSTSSDDYFSKVGTDRSFVITIDDSQELHVVVDINYPQNQNDNFYKIKEWQIEKN